MNAPDCLALELRRTATRSPSTIASSVVMVTSDRAVATHSVAAVMAAGVPGRPCDVKPGVTSSPTA